MGRAHLRLFIAFKTDLTFLTTSGDCEKRYCVVSIILEFWGFFSILTFHSKGSCPFYLV